MPADLFEISSFLIEPLEAAEWARSSNAEKMVIMANQFEGAEIDAYREAQN
jgi:hypothetical protein